MPLSVMKVIGLYYMDVLELAVEVAEGRKGRDVRVVQVTERRSNVKPAVLVLEKQRAS